MPTHQHRILAVLATVVIILWYNSLREQYYVRKRALVHPRFSPWTRLLNNGDERSFITLTGFNFASFRLMVPYSTKVLRKIAPRLRRLLLERSHIYTSLRQSSEWGMRALQGSFARLKAKLTSDKHKRQMLIFAIALLHNFRTKHVGLNQIATVFNPHYEQYINFQGYDKIRRYYAIDEDDD